MSVLIILITTIFVCIAFVTNQPVLENTFFSYFSSEFAFLVENATIFIVGIFVLTIGFTRSGYVTKTHAFHKKFSTAFSHSIKLFLLSFLLAYIFLFVIAFIQLNIFALLITMHPDALGVTQNKQDIVKSLKASPTLPQLVAADQDSKQIFVSVAQAITGKDNFYGSFVLPSIPHFLLIPSNLKSDVVLVDNMVIFSKVDTKDIQTVATPVVSSFVKNYFWNKQIKNSPHLLIMNKDQYVTYKKSLDTKTLKNISADLQTIQSTISSLSAAVKNDTDEITADKSTVTSATSQQKTAYKQCLAADTPLLTCKNIRDTLSAAISTATSQLSRTKDTLHSDQQQLANYQYYFTFYSLQKKLLTNKSGNVSNELGEFIPSNTVQIVLYTDNPHAAADYFETITHEYLHYTSYTPGKKFTDSFFEEALTEYFARNIIKEYLHTSTNLGYPLQVKIMDQIAKSISDTELEDMYMSKDEKGLELTLDRVYGDNFYENNHLQFELLQYTQDPNQALDTANKIMQLIGGPKLTLKDLASSYSNL